MDIKNITVITEFWLIGFHIVPSLRMPLFIIFLVIYLSILSSNLLIIALVLLGDDSLKSPMYFFLAHLSLSDIIFTTMTVPTLLLVILNGRKVISFVGCFSQLYLFGSSIATQCFILSVMSYDRYLAICNPLNYITVMNLKLRLHLSTWSWFFAYLITMSIVIHIGKLQFCGPNIVDHFYCDSKPLLELSCSDISVVQLQELVLGIPVTLLPIAFIVGTYICIFIAILKITTNSGRKKAFLTCSSHLTVVCTYYGTLISLYVVPTKGLSTDVTKVQSLLYTTVTPLFNPLIYSLRSKELRVAITKLVGIKKKVSNR